MSRFDLNHLPPDVPKASFTFVVKQSWRDRRACRKYPTWLFYDDSDVADSEALLVCARCPVRAQCLNQALIEEKGIAAELRFGVRGGTLSHERATLRPTTEP